MGSERWFRGAFGGTGKIFETIAAVLLLVVLVAANSRAGDLSSQPADSLNVTNSVSNVLPQAPGAPPPATQTTAPGEEATWLSGLHISGYGSQTFGMWQNPTALRQYTPSRNNLAVARSLLQIDGNYRLNEDNTFFARGWFAYEPPYSFDSANLTNPAQYSDAKHASYGHFINGYYNTYELRDAWWENKTGPLTLFVGNQIVVWGQSLAFRVGDVINPANTCWAFGFANLEQSRVAQWMVHPILNLPEWGDFTSNFVELVVQPGFQPNWQPTQYQDPQKKYRSALTAGRALPCLPSAEHGPSARFDVGYSTEPIFGANAPLVGFDGNLAHMFVTGGAQTTYRYPNGTLIYSSMLDPPASREAFICGLGVPTFFNPYEPFLKRFGGVMKCNLTLNKMNNPIADAIGDGSIVDTGYWRVPGMQPQNWNEGVRFHTLYGATEWTVLYYNDNLNGGAPYTLKWTPFTSLWQYAYPDIQEGGATVDRPLPMPASLAEYFPAVFRGEMLYKNHTSLETNEFQNMNGQRWTDFVSYMLALDLDQAYAPWLTSTGNLSANLEVLQNIVMDDCKLCYVGNDLNEHQLKNDVSVLFHVGTSWWWSDFAPDWAMIWNPKGDTFAMFPSIILNPPWTKKYFMKLQAIEILGGDKEAGAGLFKGQSYLIAQFQYNFNLM
jgi:hypothetical protein